jgi:CheY-like chemotaxis protein
MVVEDSDEDFDTVRVAFERAGLSNELRRVTSGGMCLQVLRGTGGEPVRPALVILDLNTPGTNGREVLQVIKADPALRDLPVVVLTSSAHASDLAFCYGAGANAYHIKPVRYTEHLQVVLALFAYWLQKVVLPDPDARAQ